MVDFGLGRAQEKKKYIFYKYNSDGEEKDRTQAGREDSPFLEDKIGTKLEAQGKETDHCGEGNSSEINGKVAEIKASMLKEPISGGGQEIKSHWKMYEFYSKGDGQ